MLDNCPDSKEFYHVGTSVTFPYSSLGCEIRVLSIDVNHSIDNC